MIINKILNNNVVISEEEGREIILMGRGLAFGRKVNDEVPQDLIEKKYVLSGNEKVLLSEISPEIMEMADKIVNRATALLNKKLNDTLFVALADHLHGVEIRVRDGIFLKNFLMWDIKRFFATEFEVGKFASELLGKYLGIDMPLDEAGFITLTIVNAELDNGAAARDLTMLMEEILTIVKYGLEIPLDTDDIYVERFMTHLKFFCERVLTNHAQHDLEDNELFSMMQVKYPLAYQTTQRIAAYLQQTRNYQTSDDEQLYLTIHLSRIRRKKDEHGI
ncbi:PRD domain-containing protein [Streptococcus massiliensis]|uniref:BglG family transcriptional antiterminator n=1 Tax=Streptococcus massiliensis TaxID=313439 RepID=A0A380KW82_9STRE|nr:PRD domain-containing protein [Streptococcus massiliensis]SUN75945.1 BglG family transcriptional antiterminator [Streptococcus massiliensis]